MNSYNRDSRSGGRRRGGRDSRRRDSGRREMHKAVCDECGKDCEVPFRPSGGKPIYCSDCFEGKDGGRSRRPGRKSSGGSDKQLLEQVSSLNTKLDRILKMLESHVEKKPTSKKVVIKKVAKKATSKEEKKETKKVSKKKAVKSTPKE